MTDSPRRCPGRCRGSGEVWRRHRPEADGVAAPPLVLVAGAIGGEVVSAGDGVDV